MPKTLMPSDGQQKMAGGEKLGSKLKGNQVEHLLGLDQKPHKNQLRNKMVKGKMNDRGWANDVSIVPREGKIQEGKTPTKHCNT